jgi:F0F1-type ATP synthase assembly protein I
MPSVMALMVASVASWIVSGAVPAWGGSLLSTLLNGLFATLVFYFARRWFQELRPGV